MNKCLSIPVNLLVSLYRRVKGSKLARILLLIVFIKFLVFYGFLKGFLYPRYLKPYYENDQDRSEKVMQDLLNHSKTYPYDRER